MPWKGPYWWSRVTRYPTHPRMVERVGRIAPFCFTLGEFLHEFIAHGPTGQDLLTDLRSRVA
jgi:hypothetical protein